MPTLVPAIWLTAADAHECAGMAVNVLSRVAVPGAQPLDVGVLADEEQAAAQNKSTTATTARLLGPTGESVAQTRTE